MPNVGCTSFSDIPTRLYVAVFVCVCRSGLAALLYLWLQAFYLDDLDAAEATLAECLEKWPTGGLYKYVLHTQIALKRGPTTLNHHNSITMSMLTTRMCVWWTMFIEWMVI